jgi:ProQ/FINO family
MSMIVTSAAGVPSSVPAVNGPKTLQNQQGFSRFGRPKGAPIVHRKHAGTLPLPHRCRADSAWGSAAPASPASSHFRSCSVSAVRCCGRPRSVRRCAASRAALRSYCNSMHYLRASTEGAVRIDLTGEPAGTVTAIEARHATECLAALAKIAARAGTIRNAWPRVARWLGER